jgi:hypothetical protein
MRLWPLESRVRADAAANGAYRREPLFHVSGEVVGPGVGGSVVFAILLD